MANGSFGGNNQMHPDKMTDATLRNDRGELQRAIATASRDPEFCARSTDRTFEGDKEIKKGNVSEYSSRSFCPNFHRDGCSRKTSFPHFPSEYTTFISFGYDWCVKLHQEIVATSENPGEFARTPKIAESDPPSSCKTIPISSTDTSATVLNKEANPEMVVDCSQEKGEIVSQVLKTSKKRKLHSKNGSKLDMFLSGDLDSTTTILDQSARNSEIAKLDLDPTSSPKTKCASSLDTNARVLSEEANPEMEVDRSQEKGEFVWKVLKPPKKRKLHSKCDGAQLDTCLSGGLDLTTTVREKNYAEANVVKNVLTTNNYFQEPDSSSKDSVSSSNRKLLVLDINGLLVDIVPPNPSIKWKPLFTLSGKRVYKRPFCEEFIDFCFERFDVGIWSSRTRKNLDKVVHLLFGEKKKQTLFCWDRSYCTMTGRNTLEDVWKPLVLKEIKKLWEKHRPEVPWDKGWYNETNTVLLDDSPYKALCNPPYTAIFPYPFSVRSPCDKSLGPEGGIRKYLTRLADAKDVREFIRENPFGQPPITEQSRNWKDFYSEMVGPEGLILKPIRETSKMKWKNTTEKKTMQKPLKKNKKKKKKGKTHLSSS